MVGDWIEFPEKGGKGTLRAGDLTDYGPRWTPFMLFHCKLYVVSSLFKLHDFMCIFLEQ